METARITELSDTRNLIPELFESIDKKVSKNIAAAAIETRLTNSNGVWCCVLLPVILITYNLMYNVSPIYNLTAYVAIGLLLNSLIFVAFILISYRVLRESIYGGSLASGLVATLLVYICFGQTLVTSLVLTLPAVCSLYAILRWLLVYCPKTFTLGEAIIVTHGLILLGTMSVGKFVMDINKDKLDFNNTIIYTFWLALGSVLGVLYPMSPCETSLQQIGGILSVIGGAAFICLHLMLGLNFSVDFFRYIVFNRTRLLLVIFWFLLLLSSVGVVLWTVKSNVKGNTRMRKMFHILASFVFASGILMDQEFLKLAAGKAFGLLLFVEALRKCEIEPMSSILQHGFDAYSDEKDAGCIAVTPIYLFVGLACPLLLVPPHKGAELEALSGVLSIGVGDTFASYLGSKYGRTKWEGSNRTKEGTAANVVSQIIVVCVLKLMGLLNANYAILRIMIVATASALVEAKTDQVDNLILPLISIIAFQVTSIVLY